MAADGWKSGALLQCAGSLDWGIESPRTERVASSRAEKEFIIERHNVLRPDKEQPVPRQYEKLDVETALEASGISDAAAVRIRTHLDHSSINPPSQTEAADGRYSYDGKSLLMTAGLVVLLTGLMIIARMAVGSFAGLIVAALAFALSARFQRRSAGIPMATLLAFVVFGTADSLLGFIGALDPQISAGSPFEAGHSAIVFFGAAIAAIMFWIAYRLPLAFAASMVMILIAGGEITIVLTGGPSSWNFVVWPIVFAIVTLVMAVWHDMSDVYRETARSDVAFWLHIVGGVTIAGQFFLLYEHFAHPAPMIATSPEQITLVSPTASLVGFSIFFTYVIYAILLDRLSMALIGTLFVMFALMSGLGLDLFGVSLAIAGITTVGLALSWQSFRQHVLLRLPLMARAQFPRTYMRVDGKRPIN